MVPVEPNSVHANALIAGSVMTLYDHVIYNGYQFNGHWSWIYVARNDPAINGTHIWQWMAAQHIGSSAVPLHHGQHAAVDVERVPVHEIRGR